MCYKGFFLDYLLLIPSMSWFCAQVIKMSLRLMNRRFDTHFLWSSGGMPSVHTSFVVALTLAVIFKYGFFSDWTAVCVAFSSIVVYDAMHVRLESQKHAEVLNALVKKLSKEQIPVPSKHIPLSEHIGHTLHEVLGGIGVGTVVAVLFGYLL